MYWYKVSPKEVLIAMITFREMQNKQYITINRSDTGLYIVKNLRQKNSFMKKFISPETAGKSLNLLVLYKRGGVLFPLTDCCRFQRRQYLQSTVISLENQTCSSGKPQFLF